MWPYWLMFLILVVLAIQSKSRVGQKITFAWLAVGVLMMFFIGYRHQVGGDWNNYLRHFRLAQGEHFNDVILNSDLGYVYLNWLMGKWGLGVHAVNLVCGTIFTIGLFAFARRQPYPWLALVIAFPYVVIVLGMGYTRQGVALGFIFLALNALQALEFKRYIIFIALATLFHKTALLLLPVGMFYFGYGWIFRILAIVAATYALYDALVAESVDALWVNYVDAKIVSQGAKIRVLMNLVPSLIFLIYWKNWKAISSLFWVWFVFAIGSIISIFLVDIASTAVDRITLYVLPIQIYVFSHLPIIMQKQLHAKLTMISVLAFYTLVLFVWLNFALHARYWLPYQNVLFV